MKTPSVSVIVPVYNVDSYLLVCLNSIKKQSFKDYELIIVNDCSPDKSDEIVRDFIRENPEMSIKYLMHKENRGISAARNTGIDIATGEYLYFMDSDDDITSDCLELLMDNARIESPDIVVANNYIIDGPQKNSVEVKVVGSVLVGGEILNSFCRREWFNQVWNKLYKKDFVDRYELRFVEGLILEDELWSFEVAALAKKVAFIKKCTYNYYIRPKSIISSVKGATRRWDMFYKISQLIRDRILSMDVHNNAFVAKYFLENLLVIIGGYRACGKLNRQVLCDVTNLNVMSIKQLRNNGLLPLKQMIAYSYFCVHPRFRYIWYKILSSL